MTEAESLLSFVKAARRFCEFVESAASIADIAERLVAARRVLAGLVAEGATLPETEPTSDMDWDAQSAPRDWPGFGPYDVYWEIFDPYVDEERVAGSLSDDFLDIYRDLSRGLMAFDAGQREDALWEWRFHFDCHWGDHAVDALRALQRACSASACGSAGTKM